MPGRVMWATQTCRVFLGTLRNFSRGCIRGTREMREIRGENSEMRKTQRVSDICDEIILRALQSEIYNIFNLDKLTRQIRTDFV